jgi:ActR/RegA family two-component response regulator
MRLATPVKAPLIKVSIRECTILVLDRDPSFAEAIRRTFELAGARVTTPPSAQDCLALLRTERFSAAVVDHEASDGATSEVCLLLKKCATPFLAYTGYGTSIGARSAAAFIARPASAAMVVVLVAGMLSGLKAVQFAMPCRGSL